MIKYKIDIIIPVYNGLVYLEKLFYGVINNSDTPFRLIVIDDHSSDDKVWNFLLKTKEKYSDIDFILLKNSKNIGFVKTINKAVSYTKNNFVILNTDIEVPSGWLSRLIYPILNYNNIASCTPFTNSGTICSFPRTLEDNEIFENLNVSEIDKFFKLVKKDNFVETPTGVGFCMAFNKKVVDKIGMFDEDTFGMGYGEENDWCQRAIKAGFKNVIIPNLFVYHKHGGSFSGAEKKQLMDRNLKSLLKKHPRYLDDVSIFIKKDTLKDIRDFIIILISANLNDRPVLFFDHELGGGANLYRENYIKKCLDENKKILIVSYNFSLKEFHLSFFYKKYICKFSFNNLKKLDSLMNYFVFSKIVISELVSFPNVLDVLDYIYKIKIKSDCNLDVLIHDYFCITPYVTIFDKNIPCNNKIIEDGLEIQKKEFNVFLNENEKNLIKWKEGWKNILLKSNNIVCFSKSSFNILKEYYPDIINKIKIIPHKIERIDKPKIEQKNKDEPIVIGVLGSINYIKGSKILEEIIGIIIKKKLNVKLVIIGETDSYLLSKEAVITGRYNHKNMVNLINKNRIDVFFIPSICPETFSYTTEEVMHMNLPLAVFNIGAPAERVFGYEKGLLIEKIDSEYALNKIIEFSKKFRDINLLNKN